MSDRFILGAVPPDHFDGGALLAKDLRPQFDKSLGPWKLWIEPGVPVSELEDLFGEDAWLQPEQFWTIRLGDTVCLEHPTKADLEAAWRRFCPEPS